MMYPRTPVGWTLLLGTALVLAVVASMLYSANPSGIATFLVTLLIAPYPIRAWERRLQGRGGLPSPVDVVAEPVRTGRDVSKRFEGSPYRTKDNIISAGIGLMFFGLLIGVPLLLGRELVITSFLGDLQPALAILFFAGGGLIASARYMQRGRWR